MSEIIFWSQVLQWVVILFIVILTLATMFLTGDAVRTLGPEKGAPVPKDGLPLGERVPAVMLTDARSGHSMRLDKPPDKPLMIAFLGERCSPCRALEPHLNWVAKAIARRNLWPWSMPEASWTTWPGSTNTSGWSRTSGAS